MAIGLLLVAKVVGAGLAAQAAGLVGDSDPDGSAVTAEDVEAVNAGDDDSSDGSGSLSGGPLTIPSSAQWWAQYLTPKLDDEPIGFLIAWIAKESGGNACGVGSVAQMIRDGYARETGIGQTYFETKSQAMYGTTSDQLRTACDMRSQKQLRPLTSSEIDLQVDNFLGLVRACRASANRALAAAHADFSGADYWRCVKLAHALPGVLKMLSLATKTNGNPPGSWAEFRSTIEGLGPAQIAAWDRGTARYLPFTKVFNNAETTGGAA